MSARRSFLFFVTVFISANFLFFLQNAQRIDDGRPPGAPLPENGLDYDLPYRPNSKLIITFPPSITPNYDIITDYAETYPTTTPQPRCVDFDQECEKSYVIEASSTRRKGEIKLDDQPENVCLCWLIEIAHGTGKILFELQKLKHFVETENCHADSIAIFDNTFGGKKPIAQLCHQKDTSQIIPTKGHVAKVKFERTNKRANFTLGWEATFDADENDQKEKVKDGLSTQELVISIAGVFVGAIAAVPAAFEGYRLIKKNLLNKRRRSEPNVDENSLQFVVNNNHRSL